MPYQLLDSFEALFAGRQYLHRRSNQGDEVATKLFEDLYELARSPRFVLRVDSGTSVLNKQNKPQGFKSRRGDGTFGEAVPNTIPTKEVGFRVSRGPIASVEIGVEVKILAKAMIKQIDRVISDLKGQAVHFQSKGGRPISVGIVGINYAPEYLSFEGSRSFPTDGRKYKHPIQEAQFAEARLSQLAASSFDEFLILRFLATNKPPLAFGWVNERQTNLDYGAALTRISQQYERRF